MKYYTHARTSGGFADFTQDNVFDIKRKVLLDEKNIYDTHRIMSMVQEAAGGECEEILLAGYADLKCGLIFREKGVAVLSECISEPKDDLCTRMYECFCEAKKIHDEWERLYIQRTDYKGLDEFCTRVCEKIMSGEKSLYGSGKRYRRFFGTLTADGAVNYIDELTEDIQKRYFIKGRPGTGKSTFLKRLSAGAREQGFDIEEYYCSFDKNSLDMVVIRELSVCVFDSTSPHEKFPERQTDEILDFYTASGLDGTDEDLKEELLGVQESYNAKMREGKSCLNKVLTAEYKIAEKTRSSDAILKNIALKTAEQL